ncbi:unnamed protein product, partial [Arabidopsis halleri]
GFSSSIHCISLILPSVPPLLLTPTISSSLTPAITSLFPDELRRRSIYLIS